MRICSALVKSGSIVFLYVHNATKSNFYCVRLGKKMYFSQIECNFNNILTYHISSMKQTCVIALLFQSIEFNYFSILSICHIYSYICRKLSNCSAHILEMRSIKICLDQCGNADQDSYSRSYSNRTLQAMELVSETVSEFFRLLLFLM